MSLINNYARTHIHKEVFIRPAPAIDCARNFLRAERVIKMSLGGGSIHAASGEGADVSLPNSWSPGAAQGRDRAPLPGGYAQTLCFRTEVIHSN